MFFFIEEVEVEQKVEALRKNEKRGGKKEATFRAASLPVPEAASLPSFSVSDFNRNAHNARFPNSHLRERDEKR